MIFLFVHIVFIFVSAMVTKLDESVGEVMAALSDSGMIDNSIVLFYSDNGGSTFGIHSNRGSNWPLKGVKNYIRYIV